MRIGGLLVMCHGSRFFIFIIVYFFLELAFFSLFVRWDTKCGIVLEPLCYLSFLSFPNPPGQFFTGSLWNV